MQAVPNMTVTAPRDGKELIGLLRAALAHDGPFCLRYPRDTAPGQTPPARDVAPVPYGKWEILRQGGDCAILAVGVMCAPAMEAAEALGREGLDVTVVNCRFIKPMDQTMLAELTRDHRVFITVEDGTEVNGFGAAAAARLEVLAPEARVAVMGAPDRIYEHAARSSQLAQAGLTAEHIANRVRALAGEASLSAR
jgi:1-deoxy-D-xylulose-5-phosphate synthase